MTVKQISVFVENRAGILANITSALGNAGIDILALSVADTTDFGVLRLIVNDPALAAKTLHSVGYPVSTTEVLAVAIAHHPGGLASALAALGTDVVVEYCYAFIGRDPKNAVVILRPDNNERAIALLKKGGFDTLSEDQLF